MRPNGVFQTFWAVAMLMGVAKNETAKELLEKKKITGMCALEKTK